MMLTRKLQAAQTAPAVKLLVLFALLSWFGFAQAHSTDDTWKHSKEEIRDVSENASLLGTRWGVLSLQHDDQFTLRLEIATDMMRGSWVGDYRSAARIVQFEHQPYRWQRSGIVG